MYIDIDIGVELDEEGRVSVHTGLVQTAVKQLGISAATINVHLMLHSKLDSKRFVPEGNNISQSLEKFSIT